MQDFAGKVAVVTGAGQGIGRALVERFTDAGMKAVVADVVPGCEVDFADGAGPDTRSYRVSFEKIKTRLPNFKPQWDARKGAEQLYKAYSASGITLEDFEGPRYQRIGHINKLLADGILQTDLRHSAIGSRHSATSGASPSLAGS